MVRRRLQQQKPLPLLPPPAESLQMEATRPRQQRPPKQRSVCPRRMPRRDPANLLLQQLPLMQAPALQQIHPQRRPAKHYLSPCWCALKAVRRLPAGIACSSVTLAAPSLLRRTTIVRPPILKAVCSTAAALASRACSSWLNIHI